MKPIERYRYLMNHWEIRINDATKELEEAKHEYIKWRNRLDDAEKAEKLVAEDVRLGGIDV